MTSNNNPNGNFKLNLKNAILIQIQDTICDDMKLSEE